MHTSKVKNQKILYSHPRYKYYPSPRTNELLLCVPEQTTGDTFTYLPHYSYWDALDCCYSFHNGPCCPRMIYSETLPHHTSIALSHQSFRRCRADELLQLVIQFLLQDRRSNAKHNIGECGFHLPSHLFCLIKMAPVHHLVLREVALHDPPTLYRRAYCSSTVNNDRLTNLFRQSTNPGKHLCLLITTFVLPHPDVIQTYLSHRDTINSMYIPFQISILPVCESRI